MPTYKGGTTGQAPLRFQLRAPAGLSVRLFSIYAAGETTTGAASRVAVTRPGTLGVGNSLTTFPLDGNVPSRCTLSDSFSVGSSLPALSTGPFALPILVRWEAPKGHGLILGTQGADSALLIYANASGGHLWSSELTWEEL